MISEESLTDLVRLVDWTLRRWRTHRDWDDLRQEAIIRAWGAVERPGNRPECAFSTVVVQAAKWAVRDFFYPRFRIKEGERSHHADPETISLEEWNAHDGSKAAAEDFVPDLLDRLETESQWQAAAEQLSPEQRDLLWRRVGLEHQLAVLAISEEVGATAIHQRVKRGLTRARKAAPVT